MKTITDIEEEYKNYEIKNKEVTSIEEFHAYLTNGIYDALDNIKECKKEIRINKQMYIPAAIRNLFPIFFEQEDLDLYIEDNQLLIKMIRECITQKGYFEKILEIATEDNYVELLRLTNFSSEYYCEYVDYIDMKRTSLEAKYKGFTVTNNRSSDNTEEFDKFFIKKIEEIEKGKIVEKCFKKC